jgi:hypothetical protein
VRVPQANLLLPQTLQIPLLKTILRHAPLLLQRGRTLLGQPLLLA